jgi:hypothetical protein
MNLSNLSIWSSLIWPNGFKFDKNTTIDLNVPLKSVIYAATASPNTTTVSVLYLVP